MKVFFVLLLLLNPCQAITKEVVQVYCSASYHDTDSATQYGVKGRLIQAAVIDRAMVLSGAFPEDLAKAVFLPFRLATNNPAYTVQEANLLVLCQLSVSAERDGSIVELVIDCSKFTLPEIVEVPARQVLTMAVECIRRTLRQYYQQDAHESFECHISLKGLADKNLLKSLADLKTTFDVGTSETTE